jgi:hypothetical protein
LIHNIRQFGEHWSWRCGVQWTRASEGWKSGACRYDHTVGSWDELVQQSAEHLAEWHGITPVRAAGAVPDTPTAADDRHPKDVLAARIVEARRALPNLGHGLRIGYLLDELGVALEGSLPTSINDRTAEILIGATSEENDRGASGGHRS